MKKKNPKIDNEERDEDFDEFTRMLNEFINSEYEKLPDEEKKSSTTKKPEQEEEEAPKADALHRLVLKAKKGVKVLLLPLLMTVPTL